ncbi:hypothetical protein DXG03_007839 [Asterophora parasitica]|uniref:Uncharacterized protein n=1 Tax=Asterophora parasitica TaxID=117018 RepID=A0A9P7GEP4_9AGAR|nr:hypothetical protein DXG03_007839 [Asterophora parasitica]
MSGKLPVELFFEIFRAACTDDGTTGRALSLVSRYFHGISDEFKLQSVCVVGACQLVAFAEYLAAIPAPSRRVRHLFISIIQEPKPTRSKCRRFKDLSDDFWEHEGHISATLNKILQFISSTLETFHLVSNIPRTSILAPVPLPRLRRLTIYGPMHIYDHFTDAPALPVFPSLRNLDLNCFYEYPGRMLRDISSQAPSLQNLSFAPTRPACFLPQDLSRALGQDRHHESQDIVPSSLGQITVHVGPDDKKNLWIRASQRVMLDSLSKIMEADKRVTVVGWKQLHTWQGARERWLQDCDSR